MTYSNEIRNAQGAGTSLLQCWHLAKFISLVIEDTLTMGSHIHNDLEKPQIPENLAESLTSLLYKSRLNTPVAHCALILFQRHVFGAPIATNSACNRNRGVESLFLSAYVVAARHFHGETLPTQFWLHVTDSYCSETSLRKRDRKFTESIGHHLSFDDALLVDSLVTRQSSLQEALVVPIPQNLLKSTAVDPDSRATLSKFTAMRTEMRRSASKNLSFIFTRS